LGFRSWTAELQDRAGLSPAGEARSS